MSDTTHEQTEFSSATRKDLFLECARKEEGTTTAEVHRIAQERGDTVTEEAYYNIARRLVHRGLLTAEKGGGVTRYKAGAPAQGQWLEEDDLSALVDPEYPLLAVTIWQESRRQINEVPESLWVELRERLRNQPAPDLFHRAIVSYCDDFLAQIAALSDPKSYEQQNERSAANQEAENTLRLLLQLTKYGLGLSREAVKLPINVKQAIDFYPSDKIRGYVNEEHLKLELERRIANEPFVVEVRAAHLPKPPLVVGGVDGSTRGGILSFLGEEGDFNVGHSPMIAINTAVGQVDRNVQYNGRTLPAFIRLPEKPEDMQRQDNRYTVMAKLLFPDMSDAQYMHSVWNAMDLIEAKAALRLLSRWPMTKPNIEIPAADIVLRDGTVSPQDRDSSHYKAVDSYGQIVRDMIDTNWEIVRKCRDDGHTLAGVVKNAQLSVYAPVINWYAGQLASTEVKGGSQLVAWPMKTMNLIPDQILLTKLLTAERRKGASWDRTCVVLRPFHALSNYARTYSRKVGPSYPMLNDYNEAKEKLEELDQEERHFWGTLFRGVNDPYVKMLENVYYGSVFIGAVPRLDNEKNLPRLEFLVPAGTQEIDKLPWDSADAHRDRLLAAIRQTDFDVSTEHSMFADRAKLDVLPSILIRVHDTVKHWAADLLSRVQEYVGFHLARYVRNKKIRGVQVRPFTRDELELLHAQLRQEREAIAGAPPTPPAISGGDPPKPRVIEGPEKPKEPPSGKS